MDELFEFARFGSQHVQNKLRFAHLLPQHIHSLFYSNLGLQLSISLGAELSFVIVSFAMEIRAFWRVRKLFFIDCLGLADSKNWRILIN